MSEAVLPKSDQLVVVRKHGTVHVIRCDVVASKTAGFGQGLEQAGDIGGLVEGLAQVELIHHAIDAPLEQLVKVEMVVGEKREKNGPSFCGLA